MRDDQFEYEKYYDDYETGGFIKNPKRRDKPKNKKKGHQSKRGEGKMWADMAQFEESPSWSTSPIQSQKTRDDKIVSKENSTQKNNAKKEFIPGPNSHVIKGVTIDYDRVADMEKVENEFNDKTTYGIKFTFKGNKGSSRTIWYNEKLKWRDSDFNKEYVYWNQLQGQ